MSHLSSDTINLYPFNRQILYTMTPTRIRKRPNFEDDSEDDAKALQSFAGRPSSTPQSKSTLAPSADDDDDNDDYMNMIIQEPVQVRESLSQKQKRKQRESEIRGRPKSKAELAREEKEKREAALAKSLIDAQAERSNKGLRMMKLMGFMPGKGLGKGKQTQSEGEYDVRLDPIGISPKEDRAGIGHAEEQRRRLVESLGGVVGGGKRRKMDGVEAADPTEFRERVRMEREEKRKEGQLYAAQKVCEMLDSERVLGSVPGRGDTERDTGKEGKVPLKSVNVMWRGLVRYREEKERNKRMRYDMEQGLATKLRFPGYDKIHELDTEDKIALGMDPPSIKGDAGTVFEETGGEEAEEDDSELQEFESLSFAERLEKVVGYLRTEYQYCFWCKHRYTDGQEMEGCPGTDEDSHG